MPVLISIVLPLLILLLDAIIAIFSNILDSGKGAALDL
jgi:hypothetical protein